MTTAHADIELRNGPLPADIVLAPAWWFANAGITFDRDLFFHPLKRVESEREMEQVLYDKWGQYGFGEHRHEDRPEVGAVHLAAGYLIQEMLGCPVEYFEDQPPQAICANRDTLELDPDAAFASPAFKDFNQLVETLKAQYGTVCGDVNWSGILNIALDLRGQAIFTDIFDRPGPTKEFFQRIASVIERFVDGVEAETGTSSISVNRTVRHISPPIFLHSECSHTMISTRAYDEFLLGADLEWSARHHPFGIHFCGEDPHRFAKSLAKIPHLEFLDVGWGGDVKTLREHLPSTFLNIRLSPVEIIGQSVDEVHDTIERLVDDSGNPWLTGVCCINMDHHVQDEKITAIFDTVSELRQAALHERS